MKTNQLFLFLLILFTKIIVAQPGKVNMTPKDPFGFTLVKSNLIVPDKFKSLMDTMHQVYLPEGYKASVFYIGGLTKPRVLEISPNGILHVIDYKSNGSIYALPDKNKDDIADSLIPVITGVNAHCFKFYQKDIYVAEETRILKCSDIDNNGFFETKIVLIDSIGLRSNYPGGGHTSRTILIDANKQKIYVSIGSAANVAREEGRAIIEQYNLDGTGRKIYATGIRNAVGLAFDPNGNFWANNNGSDQQGNDIPPEWISVIEDSGYYGYPFAYGNQVWFNMEAHSNYKALKPITFIDTLLVNKMKEPGGLIQAHSAPMELEFSELAFRNTNNGFFTTLRGSWNRTPATGYKLIFLTRDMNGPFKKLTSYADFMTGFLTDSINKKFWARPVGLAIQPYHLRSPDIYLSSDAVNTFILKLSCESCSYIGLDEALKNEIKTYPNPFLNEINFEPKLPKGAEVQMFNLLGMAQTIEWDNDHTKIKVSELPNGIYLLQVKTEDGTYVKKMLRE